jgi:hypothetical protein
MKVVIKLKKPVLITNEAMVNAAEYQCSYGSSFKASPEGTSYVTCRGNYAAINAQGYLTLEGTRHGCLDSALPSLLQNMGMVDWELPINAQVIEYSTSQPTWKWWERLEDAAKRGDKAAIKEQAYREDTVKWAESKPQSSAGYETLEEVDRILHLPNAIAARALELADSETRRLVKAIKEWYGAKPQR